MEVKHLFLRAKKCDGLCYPSDLTDEEWALIEPLIPPGKPDDIAQMALFLASDRSSFVNGQAIVVDGAAASGVLWADQTPAYKTYRPIKVYNPDRG